MASGTLRSLNFEALRRAEKRSKIYLISAVIGILCIFLLWIFGGDTGDAGYFLTILLLVYFVAFPLLCFLINYVVELKRVKHE